MKPGAVRSGACSLAVVGMLALWPARSVAGEPPPDGRRLTLEDAVRLARERSIELRIQARERDLARAEIRRAGVSPNPELELAQETDALFGDEGEGGYSVGLSQTFLIGPKRRHRTRIAELDLKRADLALNRRRATLVAQVRENFYTVLLQQERLKLATEAIEINRRLVELTEGRFREGFAPELDLGLARIQLEKAARERAETERGLELARSDLAFLLGGAEPAPLEVEGSFRSEEVRSDREGLIEEARSGRPDLRARVLGLDRAATELELARSERVPDLTVSMDLRTERSIFSDVGLSDTDRLIGLRLAFPLPLFDRRQGEIARARAEREKTGLELDLLRATIEKEVGQAYAEVQAAREMLELLGRGTVPLSENHFRLTQQAYSQGQAGILDVIEAERRFAEARTADLEGRYRYTLALVRLEHAVGGIPADGSEGEAR